MSASFAPDSSARRLRRAISRVVVMALLAGICAAVVSGPAVASPMQVDPPTSDTTSTTTTTTTTQPPPPPTTQPQPPPPPVTTPAVPPPVPPPAVAPPAPPAEVAPPVSLPPDIPVVAPPIDPNLPAPPPGPPLPDPSPQVAAILAQLQTLGLGVTMDAARAKLDQAAGLATQVQVIVDSLTRDRDAARKALTDAATAAYVQGVVDQPTDQPMFPDPSVSVPAENVRMLAGNAIDHTHDELVVADAGLRIGQRVFTDLQQQLADARAALDHAQSDIETADATAAQVQAGGVPSTDLSPTVLGQPTLTANEIVGWYQSKSIVGWAGAVDLPTMAGFYITEGSAEGVRGDVAFAQAMVETGAFTSPLTRHNNYAGIGACDSCATGFDFGDPQLGVRAQMQLLHAYADKTLSLVDLANPAVGANPDHLSVRGCCPTWNKLTGTWATDPNYGPKIMTVYLSMLQYALSQRTALAAAGGAPPPAPSSP